MRKVKNLFMLGMLTVMVGLFVPACVLEGDSYVRFTWEAAERNNITHISVSEEDVDWWYDDVYYDFTNDREDFSAIPRYYGNPSVPSIAKPYDNTNRNKGKYFLTDAGSYTAVCGAQDSYGLAEIVANYTITVDNTNGESRYFEIAFNVGDFLDGVDDLGWDRYGPYDNEDTDPWLYKKIGPKYGIKKVAQKQYKQSGATLDVTYYVIRRPEK